MSTPDATGTGRPLRTAGLALLAIAGISLLIALVTWLGSGGDDEGSPSAGETATEAPGSAPASPPPAPTATETAAPSPGGAAPGTPGGPGQPGAGQPGSSAAPDTTQPPANGEARPTPTPSGDTGAAGPAAGGKGGAERAELRVYNNSTLKGLAARAADDFSDGGWPVIEVGNYSGGRIPTSTVYYQPGTGQQGPAEALGEQFELRVEPRFTGIRNSPPGVIVIVTNDYRG
ncbi:MAG: LytR family transcriptional regulator [Pseudonocardiaceae bacterium]|nr:LytR family transcriptional regulator [Pseudonocardiaceae bacterium]